MSLLSKYLMRSILLSTLLVLLVLLSLSILFEFIGQVDDVEGDFSLGLAFLYALLRVPQLSFEMMPVAALIGSLLGLGDLAKNSELIVMRTAGLSIHRLAGMVAISGVTLMVLTALIGEFIGPPLDYFARNMRDEARYSQQGRDIGNAAWVKDGPVIMHLERINTDFDFGSIYLFRFNEDNTLRSIALAENSGIDENDKWILRNFRETRFQDDGVQVVSSRLAVESFDVDSDLLGVTLVKPISLSARGLKSYVDYLKKNDLSAIRYEMELWSRVSKTAVVAIMPILALAFVFGTLRSSGAGARLMTGVMIGLGYFLASETLSSSGQVFDLNPVLVTSLPAVILLAITVFSLNRVR